MRTAIGTQKSWTEAVIPTKVGIQGWIPAKDCGNDDARLHQIYQRLLKFFGPQGWWPTTPFGSHGPRYHPGHYGPLGPREKLEVCLGAILTQNTAWKNVERALQNLHGALPHGLNPRSILGLGIRRLEQLIRPSGYFRQKARRLRTFCGYAMKHGGGRVDPLLRGSLVDRRRELLGIVGIGPETADSMLLYAGGRPLFVIDAYTRRITERLGLQRDGDYQKLQGFFQARLPHRPNLFQEYHALWVSLAKDFCKKKPVCVPCPLNDLCATGKRMIGKT